MINITNAHAQRVLLEETKTIAVVGLSPKTDRPSNMVARYLMNVGYVVIPVNPGQTSILDQKCYANLRDIPVAVDIVNIFRRSEDVYPIVEAAVEIGAKAVWMQQGIVNAEAAALAEKHGLNVTMDRCIKIEHQSLFTDPS